MAKEYEVTVNFCGFIGGEEYYNITAENEDYAEDYALDEAKNDLIAEKVDDGEYQVNFAGGLGVEETYFADDEDEALEKAAEDLTVDNIELID